jgi:hypothetical protein
MFAHCECHYLVPLVGDPYYVEFFSILTWSGGFILILKYFQWQINMVKLLQIHCCFDSVCQCRSLMARGASSWGLLVLRHFWARSAETSSGSQSREHRWKNWILNIWDMAVHMLLILSEGLRHTCNQWFQESPLCHPGLSSDRSSCLRFHCWLALGWHIAWVAPLPRLRLKKRQEAQGTVKDVEVCKELLN